MVTAAKSAWVPHAVLLLGLALVVFPVYVAFVASTLPLHDILDAPMTLVPGPNLLANYGDALSSGTAGTNGQPVARMIRHGARHRRRQDRDLAALGLCRGILSLPAAP